MKTGKIIKITEDVVYIGYEDGSLKEISRSSIDFEPNLNDIVEVYGEIVIKATTSQPKQREQVLKTGANLFRKGSADGGSLTIYTDGLLFKPHKINLDTSEVWISMADITNVEPFNNMLIIPNGLRVNCKVGSFDFVVMNRARAIEAIRKHLK